MSDLKQRLDEAIAECEEFQCMGWGRVMIAAADRINELETLLTRAANYVHHGGLLTKEVRRATVLALTDFWDADACVALQTGGNK